MSLESEEAVRSVLSGTSAFCKFLSANDCGATGSHQAGLLVSRSAWSLLFPEPGQKPDRQVFISWPGGYLTKSRLVYYESKNELRITRFGRGFRLLRPERVGSLLVLSRQDMRHYTAHILDSADDTDAFLEAFALSAADTNRLLDPDAVRPEARQKLAIDEYISGLACEFPSTDEVSRAARRISDPSVDQPDDMLLEWIRTEYALFRALEEDRYGSAVRSGFGSIDAFLDVAKTMENRRKSRAGKSLENHLAELFQMHGLRFRTQAVTEKRKRPDFLFPSKEAYDDPAFPVERLATLAAKTTCKDRWRQILNEADRLRERPKYLCTLQQGISTGQLEEMEAEQVVLVVPRPYVSSYPARFRASILTLEMFIQRMRALEAPVAGGEMPT